MHIRLVPAGSTTGFESEGRASILIGRDGTCDVALDDAGVSRRHARLDHVPGRWRLTDLGRRHGTYLNDVRLEDGETTDVALEDLVRIGSTTMQILPADAEPPPPSPLTPDPLVTRRSMFGRLASDQTAVREITWQRFCDRYAPLIVGFARSHGLAKQADDVVQDVFRRLVEALPDFSYDPQRGRFRGFLMTITRNVCHDRWRDAKRDDAMQAGYVERLEQMRAVETEWSRQWTRGQIAQALAAARAGVESRTWEAFELYGRRGVPCAEVARQLGMTPESVRKAKSNTAFRVRDALERLREEDEGTAVSKGGAPST